ncbi:MAG: TolB family protein, partial [Myxococcaceae bacterium]
MRKLETPRVELYYPEANRDEALRIARRLDWCVELLRKNRLSSTPRPKVLAYLTTADFDNAYVQPQLGGLPLQMVLAQHFTTEGFNLLEIGTNHVDDVSCHEAVHYVQFAEVDELWYYLNLAFGDLLDPNIATEAYFLEGLATYYEGRLDRATGRPHSPIWQGLFDSGVALRKGDIYPGDMSPGQRELLPFGGQYVVGSQFITWLARRYGAEKLWELIDVQGSSWIPFLGVSFRFMWVYGKDPGGLVAEWRETLQHSGPWRERPESQKVLDRDLGYFARIASAPDGTLATITAGLDFASELRISNPDGSLRFRRRLTNFLPVRPYIVTSPNAVSGLSFDARGDRLFVVMADIGIDGATAPRLLELDAHDGRLVRTWDLPDSLGGGVDPAGTRYVFVRSHADTGDLWELDLATGEQRPLTHNRGRLTLGAPAPAADGRIVFSRKFGDDFDLWIRLPDGTEQPLTRDGKFNYSPRWDGPDRVIALHEVDGRTQAVRIDVANGAITVLSDAPFVVLDPVPLPGNRLAFVNRDGWSWTLDWMDIGQGRVLSPEPTLAQVEASEPAEPAVPILSDEPYHAIDNLLIPTLRGPFVAFGKREVYNGSQNTVYAGISLQGSDRLGLHNYALNLGYETDDPGPTFSIGYGNYQLAPVYLQLTFSRAAEPALLDPSNASYVPSVVDYAGQFSASRTFWTTPVALNFLGVRRVEGLQSGASVSSQLLGPGIASAWSALESTPYAGPRLGVATVGSVQWFSKAFGSDFSFADVAASVGVYTPLPFWARHTLLVTVRGRALPGSPARLLRVGGSSLGLFQWESQDGRSQLGTGLAVFPDITFREPLRGYEDVTLRTNAVAIAGLRYKAPIIIDYGWASFLWLFPSFFV